VEVVEREADNHVESLRKCVVPRYEIPAKLISACKWEAYEAGDRIWSGQAVRESGSHTIEGHSEQIGYYFSLDDADYDFSNDLRSGRL
jgi:hypothetical protein